MPDQAPPAAPEGCVYGPWWDEDIRDGGCWCYSDGKLSYAWLPSFFTWVVAESAALRELLRLAKENAELWAENESLKTQACAFSLDATSAIVARCKREGKLTKFIKKTIELYGQPGGPWNIPSDPGGWLNEARVLLGEPTVSHEETMKEIEE